MLPPFACFLAATLASSARQKELDWNLHTTQSWEKRIPFASYVQPSTAPNWLLQQASAVPQFSTLPVELQFRILSFCCAPTLFQIMHVSSTLRTEASKLFWSKSNAYFHVSGYWLLSGGYPGDSCWDLSFLLQVQNVEIEYDSATIADICPLPDGVIELRQDRITAFWNIVKQRFPSARRVLLTLPIETIAWWKDSEPVLLPFRALVQACPVDIEVYALVLEEQRLPASTTTNSLSTMESWQDSVYQRAANGTWAKVTSLQKRKTILMPMKEFNGPVGQFLRIRYEGARLHMRKRALWPLMIKAVAQHYLCGRENEAFSCPSSTCNAHFAESRDWILHAAQSHSQDWKDFEILPSDTRAVFKERAQALESSLNHLDKQYAEIIDQWNGEGGKNQREIEQDWIEQLENDKAWDTGKCARESRLWLDFVEQSDTQRVW
jgi:hypothetical protein